jgi:multicomponent K+:H+ antiporter subunit A
LLVFVLFAVAAGAWPFFNAWVHGVAQAGPSVQSSEVGFTFVLVWCIGMAATVGTVVMYQQRLLALLLVGAVGLVVSLAFVYFSAPDLALTQLLVEVATVILMMLALHWLPAQSPAPPEDTRWRRGRDAAVAIAAGTGLAALAYMVLGRPFDSISPYFLTNTMALGGGANAVNVIIVDFRGFDTLGEITVMGIAALIIHAMLADYKPSALLAPAPNAVPQGGSSLMLTMVSRLLLPLAVVVSVYLYLRGHNLPGGGFIAGLLLAIALILQFVAHGQAAMGQRMRMDFAPWMGWGLLLAGTSGLASWFFQAPFLTTTYDYPVWPLVGAVPLASAFAFDLGVFLTVTGATMVALLAIARLSGGPASHRKNAQAPGAAQ